MTMSCSCVGQRFAGRLVAKNKESNTDKDAFKHLKWETHNERFF